MTPSSEIRSYRILTGLCFQFGGFPVFFSDKIEVSLYFTLLVVQTFDGFSLMKRIQLANSHSAICCENKQCYFFRENYIFCLNVLRGKIPTSQNQCGFRSPSSHHRSSGYPIGLLVIRSSSFGRKFLVLETWISFDGLVVLLCSSPTLQTVASNDMTSTCLLYTSDAADDLLCVDLGGRRIIKKKN